MTSPGYISFFGPLFAVRPLGVAYSTDIVPVGK